MSDYDTRHVRKQCPKCVAPKIDGEYRSACDRFVGYHGICHECGFSFLLHRGHARMRITDRENFNRAVDRIENHNPALTRLSDVPRPRLTVIEGGLDEDDADRYCARLGGERNGG